MRLTIFFLLFSLSGIAQKKLLIKASSELYIRAMEVQNPTGSQLDTLIRLSDLYKAISKDSALALGERAIALTEDFEDQTQYAKALLAFGDSKRIFGDAEEGKELLLKAKSIGEQLESDWIVADADNRLGVMETVKGNFEVATNYYLSALEKWTALKDTQNLYKPYMNLSWVNFLLDRVENARLNLGKGIEWAELSGNENAMMNGYSNRGTLFKGDADEYNGMADTIRIDSLLYRDSARIFMAKAEQDLQRSLVMAKRINDKMGIVRVITNLVDIKVTTGAYKEAIVLGKEAEPVAIELGSVRALAQNKASLSNAYRGLGDYKNAIIQAEELLRIGKENDMQKEITLAYQELYKSTRSVGQYAKAVDYLEKVRQRAIKRGEINRNKAVAEVQEKYQAAEKEKEILQQKNDILNLEAENSKIERQRNLFVGGTLFLGIIGFFGYQWRKIQKDRNDKKAFAEALIFAQEEERKRIARDLHDGIGQSLLLLKKQMDTNQDISIENQKMIGETLEEVRSISRDLHPLQLEKFGLTSTIEEAIMKVGNSTNLFVSKEIENIDGVLNDKSEIHLFRTIQESLSNIVKHAEATAAQVIINKEENELSIQIKDNGKGFDHELAVITSKSLGLRTMYERISAIGGKLKFEQRPPKGTIVDIRIPIG